MISGRDFYEKCIDPYHEQPQFVFLALGYIVWRPGTGENCEILFLRVHKPRKGIGTLLLRQMVGQLVQYKSPANTVYGFCRTMNTDAQGFYRAMGFDLTTVKGVYADGDAVVFSQPLSSLVERLNYEAI